MTLRLKPGSFLAFRSKAISWSDILLDFVFSATHLLNNYYFQKKRRWLPINRYKIRWQMVQIKNFTAPQRMPNFQFSRRANWPWRDKILSSPELGQKIIVNQRKAIWVVFSIKPFTRQSFRQKYWSCEIELAVFTETAS